MSPAVRKVNLLALIVLVVGALAGCGTDTKVAQALVAEHFEAIRHNDVDRAMALYSPLMYQIGQTRLTEEDWKRMLVRTQQKLGDLQSYRLTGFNVSQYVGTGSPSGAYYVLQYEVQYSRYTATERLTVLIPVGGSEKDAKIVGHIISSQGLLE